MRTLSRRLCLLVFLSVLSTSVSSLCSTSEMEKVEYFADSIAKKDGKSIRLLGGSSWILSSPSLALVTDDLIIVFQKVKLSGEEDFEVAIAYIDGEEIAVKHVSGHYVTSTGYLTSVVEALGNGQMLTLADGSLLSVPEYDRYDTGWWLPPYKALLTENKTYLWNLKRGKRIWVNSTK